MPLKPSPMAALPENDDDDDAEDLETMFPKAAFVHMASDATSCSRMVFACTTSSYLP